MKKRKDSIIKTDFNPNELARVLWIDDDSSFPEAISNSLENPQFSITTVSTLEEASKLLTDKKYQMVIADVTFDDSKINGGDFILNNASLFKDTKTVLVSGHSLNGISEKVISELSLAEIPIIGKSAGFSERIAQEIESVFRERSSVLYEDVELNATPSQAQKIMVASEENWSEIIANLSKNPEQLYSLSPRKFEELIAELLLREGMEVHLTPAIKDGGRDILAISQTAVGNHLYLVECKRYSKTNPVDVSLVRALYGVVEAERATSGLIVTTSYFTKPAINLRDSLKHRLSLRDYKNLEEWLKNSLSKRIIY